MAGGLIAWPSSSTLRSFLVLSSVAATRQSRFGEFLMDSVNSLNSIAGFPRLVKSS